MVERYFERIIKMENIILAKRLKMLREKHGYLQKFVADKLGIRSNTLSGYETGTRSPDPEMLVKLAELYNVTTDYLLGITDIPFVDNEQNRKNAIIEKIKTEFSDADLMFKDLSDMSADQLEEVYEFIKFKKSQGEKQ